MGCTNSTSTKKHRSTVPQGVKQLRNTYNISPKLLGSGSYGKVFQAENKADPSIKVAIKVLHKSKMDASEIKALQDEVQILQALDHPNIVKYFQAYDDVKYFYLVMELCSGGELFDILTKREQPFSEKEAAMIMEKVLRALLHCHSQNIIHRDIKPENIMYGPDGEVRLVDFGLAKQTKKNSSLHTVAGTPYYIPPEVLQGSYGKECDLWSLGVVLYVMITGNFPFDGNNRAEVFSLIKKGKFP